MAKAETETVEDTARALLRAMIGGLLVGLPLLMTEEMWQHGSDVAWWKMLALLAVTFGIVVGFNALAGFRRDRSHAEVVVDSVETMGLAIVTAGIAMVILGRIDIGHPSPAAGMIALEAIPVAFGASIASAQVGEEGGSGGPDTDSSFGPSGRLFVAAAGALLFALNVAPTIEVVMLADEASPWLVLGMMLATLLLTLAIVFVAEGGRRSRGDVGPLEHLIGETIAAYFIGLGVSLALLWVFGRMDGIGLAELVQRVVVLGIAAGIGAAVGRVFIAGRLGEGKS